MLKKIYRTCLGKTQQKSGYSKNRPPTFGTDRLILRPLEPSDAAGVKHLAGDKAIADTTLNIPHPYDLKKAEEWIASLDPQYEKGKRAVFAMVLRDTGELMGAIELRIDWRYQRGEMGYWIGTAFWNKGYCTEAGRRILEYGFDRLNLNRIYANHLSRNEASGRVMQKLGMMHEGKARQHIKKGDVFEDVEIYGMLKDEWESSL